MTEWPEAMESEAKHHTLRGAIMETTAQWGPRSRPPRHHTYAYPLLSSQTVPRWSPPIDGKSAGYIPNCWIIQQDVNRHPNFKHERVPHSNLGCRPLDLHRVRRKRDKGVGVDALAPRTTLLNKTTPALHSQLSNLSAQARTFGDKTFNTVGYSGTGLPFAYGSDSMEEERLKVVFAFPFDSRWLIHFSVTASGWRLRVWVYRLGHRRHLQ